MDEIGFVLKSLVVTTFTVFCLQMKMGEQSVERHMVGYMNDLLMTKWMKQMGTGAVRMTASVYDKALGDVFKKKGESSIDDRIKMMQEVVNKRNAEIMSMEQQ